MVPTDRVSSGPRGGPRIGVVFPTDATLRVIGTRPAGGTVSLERDGTDIRAVIGPRTAAGVRIDGLIDQRSIAVDGVEVDVEEVLRQILAAGLAAAGFDTPPDVLVIVRPAYWGTPRAGRLERAGRRLADDVVLLDAAVLAVEAADGVASEGPSASARPSADTTVVVACARDRWVLTSVVSGADGYRSTVDRLVRRGGTIAEVGEGEREDRGRDSAGQDGTGPTDADVDALVAAIEDLFGPDIDPIDCVRRVVIYGEDSTGPLEQLARAIVVPRERPWAEPLLTRVVAGEAIAEIAYDRIARSVIAVGPARQPARPPASWSGRERSRAVPDQRRRWWPVLTAVVVLFLVAGAVGWAGRMSDSPSVGQSSASAPSRAAEGSPTPEARSTPDATGADDDPGSAVATPSVPGTSVPAPPTIETGRVTVTIPEGWRVDGTSDRIELISPVEVRPDPSPVQRILVQSVSVLPDTDINQLERRLREQASGPDPGVPAASFEGFAVLDHDALTYVERPIDNSVVRWLVLLRSELQVSIGCQFAPTPSGEELPAELRRACDEVVASLTVRTP